MKKSYCINTLKHIEIFIFYILTLGPLDPAYKILGYIILFLFNYKHLYLYKYISRVQLLLLFSMIFPMILDIRNVDATNSYSKASFAYLLPFIFCIIYTKKYEKKEFMRLVEKVSFVISTISLIGFLLVILFPAVIENFPTLVFYGRNVHTILLFGAIRDYSGGLLMRNCGIAFEPGAFQFVCNLGFSLYLADENCPKNSILKTGMRYIVYILAVVSTQSTTGLIILMCIIAMNMLKNKKNFIYICIVIVFFSGILVSTYNAQLNKLDTGNFGSRFENSIYVLEEYGNNILGIGSTGYDKIYAQDSRVGSWDTYTNLYLRFGLLFSIIFLGMNLKLLKLNKEIFIVVILTLLTESLLGPITIILYYYALQKPKIVQMIGNES